MVGLCLLPVRVDAGPGVVYLTFDDGPREGTREILDLLTREEVPGTFFLVGNHIINTQRVESLRLLRASPLVQIANHSLTHANERYREFHADPEGMVRDFTMNNDRLGFTQPPFPTRLPSRIDWRFGAQYIDARSYPDSDMKRVPAGVEKLFAAGFVLYGWDVEWRKAGRRAPLEETAPVVRRILDRLASGRSVTPGKVVLLMHDFHFNTPEHIERLQGLIRTLREAGVAFGLMRDY